MSFIPRFLIPALFCAATFAGAPNTADARRVANFAEPPVAQTAISEEDALRTALAERRELHLAQLLAYANAGEFPINKVSQGPINVFVDDEGHICAAANLINLDGHGALVKKTAATDNYIVLSTVKKGPLMDWMLTSGFTQEEIALIQEPYMPMAGEVPMPNEPVLAGPAPQFAAPPLTAAEERARVQGVLRGVHQTLKANSVKNLHLAAQRLEAQPKLARAFMAASKPSRVPTRSR